MSEIDLTNITRIKEWVRFKLGGVPFTLSYPMRQFTQGVHEMYPEVPFADFGVMHVKGSRGAESEIALPQEPYRRSAQYLLENKSKLKSIKNDFDKASSEFRSFFDKAKNKTPKYVAKNFDTFERIYDKEYIPGAVVDGMLVYGDELVSEVKEKHPDHHSEINTLISPPEKSFLEKQKQDLLKIALEVKEEDAEIRSRKEMFQLGGLKERINHHQDTYFWIQNNYRNFEKLDNEYFVNELEEILKQSKADIKEEYEKIKKSAQVHQRRCKKIRDKKIFSQEDYKNLLCVGKIASWVDRRKANNMIANFLIGKYLAYVEKEYGFNKEYLQFLMPWELKEILNERANIEDYDIEKRKDSMVYIHTKESGRQLLSADAASDIWSSITESNNESDRITGTTAYGGYVTGTAQVVMNPDSIDAFPEGGILVAGMTRPEYVPLMKKAAAIVTDEGGVTSHAAIASREMEIPCVIGTGDATEILSSGDTVEVDAGEGIVKIIDR